MSTAREALVAEIESLPPRARGKYRITSTGCFEWVEGRVADGYGKVFDGTRSVRAHRFVYEWVNGPLPPGRVVCHRCDNPPCIRPSHLFDGTQKDNLDDAVRKGRMPIPPLGQRNRGKTHCVNGHEFTEENTGRRHDGKRYCRACVAARSRGYRATARKKGGQP